jgi:hypothetical protein
MEGVEDRYQRSVDAQTLDDLMQQSPLLPSLSVLTLSSAALLPSFKHSKMVWGERVGEGNEGWRRKGRETTGLAEGREGKGLTHGAHRDKHRNQPSLSPLASLSLTLSPGRLFIPQRLPPPPPPPPQHPPQAPPPRFRILCSRD